MATQPTPSPPPAPPKHEAAPARPNDKAPEGAKFDAKDMIADEQRSRSAEMERKGVEQWKADHDDRDEKDKPKPVAGLRQPGEPDPNFPPPDAPKH